jgi:hypothetical protein
VKGVVAPVPECVAAGVWHGAPGVAISSAMIVRISKGRFDASRADEVALLLRNGEDTLRTAISALKGLVHHYVAIDREQAFMTNVSVCETLADAKQMNALQAMLDQRAVFERAASASRRSPTTSSCRSFREAPRWLADVAGPPTLDWPP